MRVVTRKELAKLPAGTLYAEVDDNGKILDGFLLKGNRIDDNNWFVTDIDTDSIDPQYPSMSDDNPATYDELERQLVEGEREFPLSLTVQSDEGTQRPDDARYIVYDRNDIQTLIAVLEDALVKTRQPQWVGHPNRKLCAIVTWPPIIHEPGITASNKFKEPEQ